MSLPDAGSKAPPAPLGSVARWYAEGAGAHELVCLPAPAAFGQAQLEPTALSVLAMLLPAVCTFCPWALAC